MEFSIFIILVIILAGLLIVWYYSRENIFEKHGIPYETPWPILGNMAQILFGITPYIYKLREFYYINSKAKYIGFYDFSCPVIMLRDPELVKNIGVKNFDHFVDHRGYVDPVQDPFCGKNLFSLCGDNWREIRNLLTPAFTSSKMKAMYKLMVNCSQNLASYMIEQAQKQKTLTVDSKDAFARYTNDVIGSCAFGVTIDSLRNPDNEFYLLGRRAINFEGFLSLKFLLLRNFPTVTKLFRIKLLDRKIENFFIKLVRETVALRDEKGISRPDMIQLMMETRNNTNEKGPTLTIQDMTAQAFVFFFGGFESSSSFMGFLAHAISLDSKVQEKLQTEIDEVYEKYNGDPPYEAINSMEYLDAVINETMRLYPLGIITDRICTKSFELPPALPGSKPLRLKPGDSVTIPIYPFSTDPQYFHDPETFLPERFLDDPKAILNSSTYLPFGIGPRMCIGNRFSLLQSKVMIFHLMRKCILKPSKKMIIPMRYIKTCLNGT